MELLRWRKLAAELQLSLNVVFPAFSHDSEVIFLDITNMFGPSHISIFSSAYFYPLNRRCERAEQVRTAPL